MLDRTRNNVYPINGGKIECHACSTSAHCMPHNLTREELANLDSLNISRRCMERGDILYHANEVLTKIYAVRTGSCKISIINDKGAEQVIGLCLPGEIIGLDGLGGLPSASTATALETSTICEIPKAEFHKLCETNHSFNHSFMQVIGKRISQGQLQMMLLAQMSAEARLASFFINLSGRFKERGFSATEFNLSMPRHDIANYLGLAAASLSRALASVQDKAYLKVNHHHIKILDMEGLYKLSDTTRCSRKVF